MCLTVGPQNEKSFEIRSQCLGAGAPREAQRASKLKPRMSKSEAKAAFGYNEAEMGSLPCTKNGRANVYQTADLVATYARGHRRNRGSAVTSARVLAAAEAQKVTAAADASAAALAVLEEQHGSGA